MQPASLGSERRNYPKQHNNLTNITKNQSVPKENPPQGPIGFFNNTLPYLSGNMRSLLDHVAQDIAQDLTAGSASGILGGPSGGILDAGALTFLAGDGI